LTAAFVSPVTAAENVNAGGSPAPNPKSYGFWNNVKSPDQFDSWRRGVVAFYRKAIGIKPSFEPLPLDTADTETIQVGNNVTRHRIEYNTTDGLRIPAYLFVPKTDKPVPAIIVYHGHGDGKINAAEREGTNENALARYLAETLGYIVLAPDARSFGEFKIPRAESHTDYYFSLMSKNKLYMSKLMEDGYQDLALLRSIPRADTKRIGVAGISMGSWRALNFAVLHEEAAATVVTGLYIPWDYLFSDKHCRCQHIPKLAMKLDAEDFAATVFPRDLMIQWGQQDGFYKMGAEGLIGRTEKIAGFLGFADHFVVDRHPAMGHRFSNPEIAGFFHKRFGDGAWNPKN
jgi:dienelactone hydrolase